MAEPTPISKSVSAEGTTPSAVNRARRRLLKGGAAATPVIWAVTTRPARAGAVECQTPSAYGSLSTSRPESDLPLCSGRSPSYWQDPAHYDKWPHPYYPEANALTGGVEASQFHDTGCGGGHFGSKTMAEVLQLAGQGGMDDLGAYIVAGLLNAQAGMTPVLDPSQVRNLWNECAGRGFYEPTAGVKWGPNQVVAYLKTTISG